MAADFKDKGSMMRKGYADGGSVDAMLEAKYRIATMNGYSGPKTNAALNSYANADEGMKRKFNAIGVVMANKGGLIRQRYEGGGLVVQRDYEANYYVLQPDGTKKYFGNSQNDKQEAEDYVASQNASAEEAEEAAPAPTAEFGQGYLDLIGGSLAPVKADVVSASPAKMSSSAGQAKGSAPSISAAKGSVSLAALPAYIDPELVTPTTVAEDVQQATDALEAEQGVLSEEAKVEAVQQQDSAVSDMEAAQGQAILIDNPLQREIQEGELISGVADAEKAAKYTEQVQAATATPSRKATVAGQLEILMEQFDETDPPAWAAGSMRAATSAIAARGLGASSMAGQAIIQATMEAALPIAQIDAQTQAQFESQNLSNRQQRAMLAAQQRATFLGMEFDQAFQARVTNSARISDVANQNFTAEQQIALENSRAVNTMELSNLSNRQAMVLAEASALSNLDLANLNNRQQAAVQNAQNFLQMDMANLSNAQQATMFKAQQNIQALFTDQAAENAAAQFNASSENQANQFFANLTRQTNEFNAAQSNAMSQFNANSENAVQQFNAEMQQQRDLFNAQNSLVVAQANAQWRQDASMLSAAAQNESNMLYAKAQNEMTQTNLDAYWQRERDIMSFAFTSAENAADRILSVALQEMSAEQKLEYADEVGKGNLVGTLFKGIMDSIGLG